MRPKGRNAADRRANGERIKAGMAKAIDKIKTSRTNAPLKIGSQNE